MPFDRSDLRSQLSSGGSTATLGVNMAPQAFEFGRQDPTETSDGGSRLWWVRSQAVVVNHVELAAGDTLASGDRPDEHVVLVADASTTITVRAAGDEVQATGPALVVVPPGQSELDGAGTVVRLFAAATSPDLCVRCDNDAVYATPDPNVAAFAPWPDPAGGHGLRVYAMDDHPPSEERFGRIFRCSTFMVNWFHPQLGPRDPAKMSPHHHDDFEQLSLQLGGDFVHHIRTPWTVDMADWRDDDHIECTSPSVTVIPPPSIHTSQAMSDGEHLLIDIFCPPRRDFSERPGWVINADDYPMPD